MRQGYYVETITSPHDRITRFKFKDLTDEKEPMNSQFDKEVVEVVGEVHKMLLEKNRKYGDSALNPVRLFSKASTIEQLKVRLDDKLSRLGSGQTDDTEDVELDLMGYLVMLRIAKLREKA